MSKLCANIFSIATTSNYGPQQFEKIGVVKVDYFDFPSEIFEILFIMNYL